LGKLGKTDEAAAEYTTAAQLDPSRAGMYYFNLGAILTNAGKVDDANAAFDRALAADPTRTDAYYWKGVNLIGKATTDKNGKMVAPPGTADAFKKYLELDPSGRYASAAKEMLATIGEKIETTYTKGKNR
jgi:tetratricopeptide (TPR) repeat protein